MKRFKILSLLFLFTLFMNSISAQTACLNQDDTIFRISGATNAHGEVFNGAGNYVEEICYSNLFPSSPAITSPDRSCVGGSPEKIVTLSSTTNAHAEIPGTGNYGTQICYQGLTCNSVPSSTGCNTGAGEVEVVRLSGSTNAHLELPGQNNYGTSICCSVDSVQPTGTFNNLEWVDFQKNPIPTGQAVCTNTWVKAHVTTGFNPGISLSLDFKEEDPLSDDDISSASGVLDNNGEVYVDFYLDADLLSTQNSGGNDPPYEMYFNVLEASNGLTDSSLNYPVANPDGILKVVDDPAQCIQNTGPTGGIQGPISKGIYFVDDPIQFVADCSSAIGPVTYDWKITQGRETYLGDETSMQTFPFTFGQDFGGAGQADIILTCIDKDGLKTQKQISILVNANPGLYTFVNQPAPNSWSYQTPPDTGAYFPTEVDFSSSDSYAVYSMGYNPGQTTEYNCIGYCLAGTCPDTSEGTPQGCDAPINIMSISETNSIFSANLPTNPDDFSGLRFDWNFWDDAGWSNDWSNFEGFGQVFGTVIYNALSNSIGDSHLSVFVDAPIGDPVGDLVSAISQQISQGESSVFSSDIPYQRDFTVGRCLNGGNDFLVDPINGITENTETTPNACNGGDGIAGTGDDCCTVGRSCLYDSSATVPGNYCQFPTVIVNICADFNSDNFPDPGEAQAACDGNSNTEIPKNSLGYNLNICEFAECSWNNASNKCEVQVSQFDTTANGCSNTGPNACVVSQCTYDVTETACINGQKTISYESTGTAPTNVCSGSAPSCDKPDVTVPCGNLSFELPFFGVPQFIGVVLIITILYLAFGFKKKKRGD